MVCSLLEGDLGIVSRFLHFFLHWSFKWKIRFWKILNDEQNWSVFSSLMTRWNRSSCTLSPNRYVYDNSGVSLNEKKKSMHWLMIRRSSLQLSRWPSIFWLKPWMSFKTVFSNRATKSDANAIWALDTCLKTPCVFIFFYHVGPPLVPPYYLVPNLCSRQLSL